MTDNKILITKTRSGGNRMVRADTKDGLGNGTWINANQLDNTLIDQVREIAHEHLAIADSLDQALSEGADW
jgi:hypothetical protein